MLQQLQAEGFGEMMGMNTERKMVEKFTSRLRQQKPTQELPQLTWRTREEPDDKQYENSLAR